MKNKEKLFYIWVGALIISIVYVLLFALFQDDYKRGQIDAIRGNIKYELIEQDNGESKWEYITEKK